MAETLNSALENARGVSPIPVGRFRTAQEINKRNREFWLEQSKLMKERVEDEATFGFAMKDLTSEALRQVPVYSQKSFEQALEIAAVTKLAFQTENTRSFQSVFSRKGGVAAKTDALQRLILEIVRKNPIVSERELLTQLQRQMPHDWEIVEECIEFQNGLRYKSAPISGLKDRLSRAKKKIASERKKDSR